MELLRWPPRSESRGPATLLARLGGPTRGANARLAAAVRYVLKLHRPPKGRSRFRAPAVLSFTHRHGRSGIAAALRLCLSCHGPLCVYPSRRLVPTRPVSLLQAGHPHRPRCSSAPSPAVRCRGRLQRQRHLGSSTRASHARSSCFKARHRLRPRQRVPSLPRRGARLRVASYPLLDLGSRQALPHRLLLRASRMGSRAHQRSRCAFCRTRRVQRSPAPRGSADTSVRDPRRLTRRAADFASLAADATVRRFYRPPTGGILPV